MTLKQSPTSSWRCIQGFTTGELVRCFTGISLAKAPGKKWLGLHKDLPGTILFMGIILRQLLFNVSATNYPNETCCSILFLSFRLLYKVQSTTPSDKYCLYKCASVQIFQQTSHI